MNCIFCKIINDEISSYKIYEDENILAFLDVNPTVPGHTLIIPKVHTLDINTIDNAELINIVDKARDIGKLLMDKMNAGGFTLTQNNGCAQEIKHFHLHVIPKYDKKIKMNIDEVYELLTK